MSEVWVQLVLVIVLEVIDGAFGLRNVRWTRSWSRRGEERCAPASVARIVTVELPVGESVDGTSLLDR